MHNSHRIPSFRQSCWLDYENGLIWAFAAPVLLVLSVNSVMFVKALLIARRTINRRHNVQETKNILTLVRGEIMQLNECLG